MPDPTPRHYDTILSPIITEKATRLTEANQVVFRVTLDATKPAIAKAVSDLFKVKVKAVNTVVVKGKRKFARGKRYTRSDIKKAIVGTGAATKTQVQFMIAKLLRLKAAPQPADASDGVAAALTCAMRQPLARALAGARAARAS